MTMGTTSDKPKVISRAVVIKLEIELKGRVVAYQQHFTPEELAAFNSTSSPLSNKVLLKENINKVSDRLIDFLEANQLIEKDQNG